MRMVQAHGEDEHVTKWWKRADVCCLDTQATRPRDVWIIELTWQRYVVCSHLHHKRVCVCCVKSVPATSLKYVISQSMPQSYIQPVYSSVCLEISSEMPVNAASSTKFNRDASYRGLSKIASSQQEKKCFNKDNNFSRCHWFCFHRHSIPIVNLYIFQRVENTVQCCHYCMQVVLDILFICEASFPSQLCTIKKPN